MTVITSGKDITVTIAIALHNNEKYIKRCLDSVVKQSYTQLDIIVIDDGSTDNSVRVCNKFTHDNRIRIISKENGGLSSARQLGLNNTLGDYICFIDGDDYIEPQYISVMLRDLLISKADICVCSTTFVDEEGKGLPSFTSSLSVPNNQIVVDTKIDLDFNYGE